MSSNRYALWLSWLALLLTGLFVAFAIGRQLHTELLALPVMLLAVAQILALRSGRSSK
jgi:hypothetical protein